MGDQEGQLSFACCFIISPPANFASWSLSYRFCLPRKEAEPTVTGCWIATGLDTGKGFILFSLLKKKIKTIHKNHHRDNKKMERSTDKDRDALLSCRLRTQSYVHYKLFFCTAFYWKCQMCPYYSQEYSWTVRAKRSVDPNILRSFFPKAVCSNPDDIFSW